MIITRMNLLSLMGIIIILHGCALLSQNDTTRHVNFTKLKAIHVKLFDDWSVGSGNVWNEEKVASDCVKGDMSFKEAFDIAKSNDKNGKTGQKSVKILWNEFKANCKFSLRKKKLFSKTFKDNILPEIERNYDYAIAGKQSRVSAQ